MNMTALFTPNVASIQYDYNQIPWSAPIRSLHKRCSDLYKGDESRNLALIRLSCTFIEIMQQKQVKEDLKRKREETMYQLKRQGDDRQKLEHDIFVAGCKLRTIMEENQKLEDVNTII